MPKLPRIFTQIHLNDVLGTTTFSSRQAVSGDIIRFYYKSKQQLDPQPLVLVITPHYHEKLYGINLNYLDSPQAIRLWQQLSVKKMGTIKQLVELDKRNKPFFRVRVKPTKAYYSGQLRDILKRTAGSPDRCYRSYSHSKIKATQLVDYSFPGNDYADKVRYRIYEEKLK